jgi:ketosteroid isomerase-like protein
MLDIATGADGPQSHRDTSTAAVWDDYFRVASESQTQQATVGEVAARGTGTPIEVPFGSFMPQAGMPPAEPLADDAVEAAIECLYDFLHAVARRDVTGAMALVADDYHVMVGDHEIDHGQLRHQIEALLDTRTEGELSVSLARVPQPVAHPLGVLVRATIQFDYTGPDEKETILYERVAVIGEAPDGGWKLCSMSPIEPAAP